MITVALVGPDGAGKSTVIEMLPRQLAVPTKQVYMGIRLESSDLVLPTTRALLAIRHGRRQSAGKVQSSRSPETRHRSVDLIWRIATRLGSVLLLLNLFGEEWFRQAVAWYYKRRGFIVLFDRHFIADFHAFDYAETKPSRRVGTRLHGFLLNRYYPMPDLVVYLDAPSEVLLSRKDELTLRRLERLRQGYLGFGSQTTSFAAVDATQPLEKVAHDVAQLIGDCYQCKRNRLSGESQIISDVSP